MGGRSMAVPPPPRPAGVPPAGWGRGLGAGIQRAPPAWAFHLRRAARARGSAGRTYSKAAGGDARRAACHAKLGSEQDDSAGAGNEVSRRVAAALVVGAVARAMRARTLAATQAGAFTIPTQLTEVPIRRAHRSAVMFGAPFASVAVEVAARPKEEAITGEFMLDTGLTSALVSPTLAKQLRLSPDFAATGFGAGGVARVDLARLTALRVGAVDLAREEPVVAGIKDFPQERSDPALLLNGMLGYGSFRGYDLDLDFPQSTLRLFLPGDGASAARQAGLSAVAAAQLPQSGIPGVRVLAPDGSGRAVALGVIDTGSTFTCINKPAADALGIQPDTAADAPVAVAVGVDGRPVQLRTARNVVLELGGTGRKDGGDDDKLAWEVGKRITLSVCAIGDIPALDLLASVGTSGAPATVGARGAMKRGPAVLIGLDALERQRVVLCAGASAAPGVDTRVRTIWL